MQLRTTTQKLYLTTKKKKFDSIFCYLFHLIEWQSKCISLMLIYRFINAPMKWKQYNNVNKKKLTNIQLKTVHFARVHSIENHKHIWHIRSSVSSQTSTVLCTTKNKTNLLNERIHTQTRTHIHNVHRHTTEMFICMQWNIFGGDI